MSHMARISALEYTCPLCRQIANCVLPVAVTAASSRRSTSESTSTASPSSKTRPSPPGGAGAGALPSALLWPMSGNTPAKMWILSSLIKKTAATTTTSSAEGSSSSRAITSSEATTVESLKAFAKLFSQGDDSHRDDNYLYEGILEMLSARPFSPQDLVCGLLRLFYKNIFYLTAKNLDKLRVSNILNN